ncbi:MAG: hypothetical protein DF168_00798 [Candidatus Moanabacter tarae]|uniref:Divalent metal cation transporter MntH n=1 Tax=Candidatus Moanibacter tarae TaxID=2200854 RepID=A0A2Z4AF74_9BACT|nr:MAG: hypothetical protein DF168_00798 [Candidatus Moanabacter tarae]|tara:strand:- start:46332 stop:47816 length:1485 start_codon:yes stop_codon:yes gene_type:complete
MDQKEKRYPQLAPELRSRKISHFLTFFGPGAIIASVTIGSGETVWASRSGAIFGYAMFWAFSLFCITKGVQVYSAARYMTLTGEHPMERWAFLPGPKMWFPGFIGLVLIIAFPFYLSSLPIMLGSISSWILFDDPGKYAHLIALAFIVFLIFLTLRQTYGFLEHVQSLIIGVMLIVMLIAAIAVKPDWVAVLLGSVLPQFPEYPGWVVKNPSFVDRTLIIELVAYMGVMGGGVQDYVGYVGMLREKAWGLIGRVKEGPRNKSELKPIPISVDPENIALGKGWLKAPLIDTVVSFSSVFIFTGAFLILGATLLNPREIVPSGMNLYNHQVIFLTELHPGETVKLLLAGLYKAGVLVAIFGTVYGAYELYVRTTYECVRTLSPKLRDLRLDKVRIWILTYTGIAGSLLVLVAWWTAVKDPEGGGWNPISIMTIPLHVTGVLLAGPWCFAMIWADRKFLPKPFQMNGFLVVMNIVCGVAFVVFGVLAVYDDIQSLIG